MEVLRKNVKGCYLGVCKHMDCQITILSPPGKVISENLISIYCDHTPFNNFEKKYHIKFLHQHSTSRSFIWGHMSPR